MLKVSKQPTWYALAWSLSFAVTLMWLPGEMEPVRLVPHGSLSAGCSMPVMTVSASRTCERAVAGWVAPVGHTERVPHGWSTTAVHVAIIGLPERRMANSGAAGVSRQVVAPEVRAPWLSASRPERARSQATRAPKAKPPTWAKKATPPPFAPALKKPKFASTSW
jgi:hypothetical protein